MRYFVEELVPSHNLLKQGIYLQTCGHIELVAWRLIQMVDGVDTASLTDVHSFVKLKLDTRSLVRRLRSAGTKCHAPVGLRLLLLARRIEEGLLNRNMAAHGAWRVHSSGYMEVEHYFRDHSDKSRPLKYISKRFNNRAIDFALEDADLILREAVELHDRLNSAGGRYISLTAPSGSQAPKPSLQVPRLAINLRTSTTLSRG